MRKRKKGVARLLEIAGEKKGLLATSCLLAVLSAALALTPFFCVYFILKELLSHGVENGAYLLRLGWIAFGGVAAGLLLTYGSLMASHLAAFRILYGLRMRLARHIGRLPLGYLSGTSIGAVKKTLEENVEKVELFVAHKIPELVELAATVLILAGAFFRLSVPMAAACFLSFIAGLSLQGSLWFGERGKALMQRYYESLEKVSSSAVQYVRGMPLVKIFGRTVRSFVGFADDIRAYRNFCVSYTDDFQRGYILFKVLASSFLTFLLPVGILLWQREPESAAFALTFLFFVVTAPGASAPMLKLALLASMTRDITGGIERIDAILARRPVPEPVAPQTPRAHDVEFQNVRFSYEGTEGAASRALALDGVSFHALDGTVTALVGPSGGGKSTVASLIPRFWDLEAGEGAIRIGGVDVRDIPTHKLMDRVAFVFQDTFLFFDTVRENIRVGRKDATDDEVIKAARAARCHDFIQKLPQGYDTPIGSGGVYLSGGEEQRVCIARAVLKDAPILVLDEATAFADPENEAEIQQALSALSRGKTVIVIAHRLASVKNADQILVLDEGRVVERGAHDELLRADDLYARMWRAYQGAGEWRLGQGRAAEMKEATA